MDAGFLESEIDWNSTRKDCWEIKNHEGLLGKVVPKIEILNLNRVKINKGDRAVYVANHLTHLDHFVPLYAIIENGLPFPRSIASIHFKDSEIGKKFDFDKKGVIWHDRNDHSIKYIKDYRKRVLECLIDNYGIFFHPEGKRNRNPENGLLDFKDAAFKMFFSIEDEMKRLNKIGEGVGKMAFVCVASRYDDYPEKGHYEKIGDDVKSKQYNYWEKECMLEWIERSLESKGKAKINFSEAIYLENIMGKNNREKGENASVIIRERILVRARETYQLLSCR